MAEKLVREIKGLPLTDLLDLREQVNKLVSERKPPPVTFVPPVSEEEFQAALKELEGCTAGSGSLERLLQERRREFDQEQAWLETRAEERARG